MIMLPDTELDAALITAERIRQSVAELAISYGEHMITLTTSIGIAELSEAIENLDQLTDQADKALYKAKTSGRNRTEIWHLISTGDL